MKEPPGNEDYVQSVPHDRHHACKTRLNHFIPSQLTNKKQEHYLIANQRRHILASTGWARLRTALVRCQMRYITIWS